jgi:Tetratricopeptide repeat
VLPSTSGSAAFAAASLVSRARGLVSVTAPTFASQREAHALCFAGDVASVGRAEDASVYYRDARALAEELGMRPLIAHCHLGLGRFYRRSDEPEQARAHLTAATTMYRDMDMPYWLTQAEAESVELSA